MKHRVQATMFLLLILFLAIPLIAGNCLAAWIEPPGTPIGTPIYWKYSLTQLYDEPNAEVPVRPTPLAAKSFFGVQFNEPAMINGVRFYTYPPSKYYKGLSNYSVQAQLQSGGEWVTIVAERAAAYAKGLPGWEEINFAASAYWGIRIVPAQVYRYSGLLIGEIQFQKADDSTGNIWRIHQNNPRYLVQNNFMPGMSGSHTLQVDPDQGDFIVTESTHDQDPDGPPASYPSILKGCAKTECTNNSGMPLKVDQLFRVRSSWEFSTVASGVYSASYDLLLNRTPNNPAVLDGAIMMIFLHKQGDVAPEGSLVVPRLRIDGHDWEVWLGTLDGVPCISYALIEYVDSVCDLDLKLFLVDAKNRGYIDGQWYLTTVEAGFSLWKGGVGLQSKHFSAWVE